MNPAVAAGVSNRLRRALPRALSTAILFWACGEELELIGPLRQHCDTAPYDYPHLSKCIVSLSTSHLRTGLHTLGALALIGLLLSFLMPYAIDLMKGLLWPTAREPASPINFLLRKLTKRQIRKVRRLEASARANGRPPGNEEQTAEAAVAAQVKRTSAKGLRRYPLSSEMVAPTTIGSQLNCTTEWAELRFGLDLDICLDHLLDAIPNKMRREHDKAKRRVEYAVERVFWTMLGAYWTVEVPSGWGVTLTLTDLILILLAVQSLSRLATDYDAYLRSLILNKKNRRLLGEIAGINAPSSKATEAEYLFGKAVSDALRGRPVRAIGSAPSTKGSPASGERSEHRVGGDT